MGAINSVLRSSEESAKKAYTAQNWTEAESQYSALTKQTPDHARFWYRLAVAARADKHYDVALDAMQKAKMLGAGKGLPAFVSDYEIATIYAARGDKDLAMQSLKSVGRWRILAAGPLEERSGVEGIAGERSICRAGKSKCNTTPRRAKTRSSSNLISGSETGMLRRQPTAFSEGQAMLRRRWADVLSGKTGLRLGRPTLARATTPGTRLSSAGNSTGSTTAAGVMFFHGGLKDGVMDYWTDDVPQPTGGMLLRHLQFFNLGPDKVRQFSQGSNDAGKTWHVEYDFIYTRHDGKTAAVPGS